MGIMGKRLTQEQLNNILEKHYLWLNKKVGGEQAEISMCNLTNLDLRNANLNSASIQGCDLTNVDLSGSNLCFANFSGSLLTKATMKSVNKH